ncbi:hypothetical protein Bpfe_030011 [Biomphalaria pfeifferi]|uniref:Uncharacterized protein n=1 Tax=Biomphalaria pfeifferi TaxID=112525 RepID=A0AAD8ARK2_BIOPF|nr:hypothetical protein Bpfe_030011 [Biomphalaria pfeifferi]
MGRTTCVGQSFNSLCILALFSLLRETMCSQCAFMNVALVASGPTTNKHLVSAGNNHNASVTGKCVRHQPSSADVKQLCHRERCDVVQCVFKVKASTKHSTTMETNCFSKVCELVTIYIEKGFSKSSIASSPRDSLGALQTLINELLSKDVNITKTQDLVTLKCADSNSLLFKEKLQLQLTNLTLTQSTTLHYFDTQENLSKSDNVSASQSLNVHFIYFRFLSRWESYIKFPKLHAVLELMKHSSDWKLHSAEDFQSSSLVLEHNLELLLGNLDKDFSEDHAMSLLNLSTLHGRCILFNALGCHHPKIYDSIHKLIMSPDNIHNCAGLTSNYFTKLSVNVTSCGKDKDILDNDLISEVRQMFSNIFRAENAMLSTFSFTIINVPDIYFSADLDTELSAAMPSLMRQSTDSIFFFMSDVGDPKFSRLDASIFLRQQTFNPFLFILFPKEFNLSYSLLDIEPGNRIFSAQLLGLMGISGVSNLLKTLLTSNSSIEAESADQTRQPPNKKRSSQVSIIVQGPVECICEGKRVRFSNDSIQSAFAAYVVGTINNYFLDLSDTKDNDVICERLTGVYFDNVYHVLLGNSTYIITAMSLTRDQYNKNPGQLFTLDIHLKYTTGTTMHFNLWIALPGQSHQLFQLKDAKSQMFQRQVCRPCLEIKHENLLRTQNDTTTPSFGHFGAEAKVKPLHVPCLRLITTRFSDSAILEVGSFCDGATYQLTLSAELIDTISLVPLPAKVTLRPRQIRYITSLVKAFYGASLSAYKLSFKITPNSE